MPLVLKTPEGHPYDVDLPAGVAFADGKGGIPVEDAAQLMPEFQVRDGIGAIVPGEDGSPIPLEGRELKQAAERFAEARGLVVAEVKDVSKLAEEAGGGDPAPISIEEGAADNYQALYGAFEAPLDEKAQQKQAQQLREQGQETAPAAGTTGDAADNGGSRRASKKGDR